MTTKESMDIYSDFDIKTTKNIVELSRYIRARVQLQLKNDIRQYWEKFSPEFSDLDDACQQLAGFLLHCYKLDAIDYSSEVVMFIIQLCGDYESLAYSNAFSLGDGQCS